MLSFLMGVIVNGIKSMPTRKRDISILIQARSTQRIYKWTIASFSPFLFFFELSSGVFDKFSLSLMKITSPTNKSDKFWSLKTALLQTFAMLACTVCFGASVYVHCID